MTQPVLVKQSFLIALLTALQAVMPAIVAVASLYATIIFFGTFFDPSSTAVVIIAVLCLVLVQPPREVSTQLTSQRVSAVVDVIFRWLLLLALLLADRLRHQVALQSFPRRIFLTWAALTPVALIIATLGMQETHAAFSDERLDNRSAIFAGYNSTQSGTRAALNKIPACGLQVAGFFDDRSSDRLGMESDVAAHRRTERPRPVRQGNTAPMSSSSRCPFAI